jgi:hypothetical protein
MPNFHSRQNRRQEASLARLRPIFIETSSSEPVSYRTAIAAEGWNMGGREWRLI